MSQRFSQFSSSYERRQLSDVGLIFDLSENFLSLLVEVGYCFKLEVRNGEEVDRVNVAEEKLYHARDVLKLRESTSYSYLLARFVLFDLRYDRFEAANVVTNIDIGDFKAICCSLQLNFLHSAWLIHLLNFVHCIFNSVFHFQLLEYFLDN